jgi:hypothetical protein
MPKPLFPALVALLVAASCKKDEAQPAPKAAAPAAAVVRYVSSSTANVRAQPSADAAKVGRLPIGARLEVTEKKPGWLQIKATGGKGELVGWVSDALVSGVQPTPERARSEHDNAPPGDVERRRVWAERYSALAPKQLDAVERLLRAIAHDPKEKGGWLRRVSRSYSFHAKRTFYEIDAPSATWERNPAVILRSKSGSFTRYDVLENAVRAAGPGSEIRLPQGVYTEGLLLAGKRDLTIIAPQGPALFLSEDPESVVYLSGCKRVVLDSLFVRNLHDAGNGVALVDSGDVVLRRSWIHGGAVGARVTDSAGTTIANSILGASKSSAVFVDGASTLLLHASLVKDTPKGVVLGPKIGKPAPSALRVTSTTILGSEQALDPRVKTSATLVTPGPKGEGREVVAAKALDDGTPTPRHADFSWAPKEELLREAPPAPPPPSQVTGLPRADCATAGDDGVAYLEDGPEHWRTESSGYEMSAEYRFHKLGDLCRDGAYEAEVLVAEGSFDECYCKCGEDSLQSGLLYYLLTGGKIALLTEHSDALSFADGLPDEPFEPEEGGEKVQSVYEQLALELDRDSRTLASLRASRLAPELKDEHKSIHFKSFGGMDVSGDEIEPGLFFADADTTYMRVEASGLVTEFEPDDVSSVVGDIQRRDDARELQTHSCEEASSMPEDELEVVGTLFGGRQKVVTPKRTKEERDEIYDAYSKAHARVAKIIADKQTEGWGMPSVDEMGTPYRLERHDRATFDRAILDVWFEDPWGRAFRCRDTRFDEPEEPVYAEPLVYLYAPAPTEAIVAVSDDVELSVTTPEHGPMGWHVRTRDDGSLDLLDFGLRDDALFWEGTRGHLPLRSAGWSLHRSELLSFLDDELLRRGLSLRERDDFVSYWFPRLVEHEHVFVTFLDVAALERDVPVYTLPLADSRLRVHLDFRPLDGPVDVEPPLPDAIPPRGGLTFVEWSGMEREPARLAGRMRLPPRCRLP